MRYLTMLAVVAGSLALAAAMVGCGVNFSQPVVAAAPQTPADRNFAAVWNASLSVLRDHCFTVAVQDRREGVLATGPLLGKQWFEFWRKDAVTASDLAESSIQTLYKTATVTIRPVEGKPDAFAAEVKVEVARSDKPTMDATNTSEAYGLFTMSGNHSRWLTDFGRRSEAEAEEPLAEGARRRDLPPAERLRGEGAAATQPGAAANRWRVPLGRDPALEKRMASEIASLAAKMGGRK